VASPPAERDRDSLLAEALAEDWYHTIELAPGKVTRGHVDLRRTAGRVLPDDLADRRALDVGTFDGFWAFELERRGAEVVATDLDAFLDSEWPPPTRQCLQPQFESRTPGERFWMARELLRSEVRRIGSSIYDLDSARLGGEVDYAVVGDLLLHLRDPVRGLEAVHSVLRPEGRLLVVEPIDLWLTILRRRTPTATMRAGRTEFDWWVGNVGCLRDWLRIAGFADVRRVALFRIKAVKPMRQWHVALECTRP
jgi:tRNA (mo5U34)-methyltransferase